MLRVAMLSKWHVHAGHYAQVIQNHPDAEIAVVWDEDALRGRKWAEELGVEFEPDLDKVLARSDVDAVLVDAPTNMHPSIMIAAAEAGKHIFTEKVAALNAAECEAICEAVNRNNVVFTISFPQRCQAKFLYAKKLVEEGTLGDITMFRIRNGHDGATANWLPNYWYSPETTGGGAMMDLGAHPMYLAGWMFGEAASVSSCFTHYTHHVVEDSAVCNIRFKNGTVAVVESTLASYNSPYIMEIYGTRGTYISAEGIGNFIATDATEKKLVPAELPEDCKDLPAPLEQFVDSCLNGAPVRFGTAEALQLSELMEAAYRSDDEEREIWMEELYD